MAFLLFSCTVKAASEEEILDLTNFYTSTGGSNWTTNTNWLNGGDPCDFNAIWFGVHCTLDGNVSAILLQQNNIVGSIPPLDHLTSLSSFVLPNNQITNIPQFSTTAPLSTM